MNTKITLKLAIILLFIVCTTALKAEIPQAINFQAIARDADGNVMANTPIQIQLSVLDGTADGPVIYKELRALTTNAFGSFSFQIGVDPYYVIKRKMEDIDWVNEDKYLKIDYDPTNQLQFDLTLGTIRFVSVPYAFAAGSVYKIDLSGAIDGDVLMYNSATENFEPSTPNVTWANVNAKPLFSTVATSGSYNDLSNKPGLATIATSGSYNDLSNKPDFTNYVTLNGNQTITGTKTFNGTVSVVTPVNNSDAANKAYIDQQIAILKDNLMIAGIYQITDVDGNNYKTKKIGDQVWMAEDLRTTKYNDGTPIPYVTYGASWNSLTTGAYCWYNNDEANYRYQYGALYNYYAVMNTHNLCPTGWHVPTETEFVTLENTLGGSSLAGGKLKEAGLNHWDAPNSGANNSSGFSALPGYSPNIQAQYWSSTTYNATSTYMLMLHYLMTAATNTNAPYTTGNSVRCIKD